MYDTKTYVQSNLDLIDIIKTSSNQGLINEAKIELASRDLNRDDLANLEEEYVKFKEREEKRKTVSLTTGEWLYFLLVPFWLESKYQGEDQFTESEFTRFQKHGFIKKWRQATMAGCFGHLFWLAAMTAIIWYVMSPE